MTHRVWQSSWFCREVSTDAVQWGKLESAGKVQFDDAQRGELVGLMNEYLELHGGHTASVRSGKVKAVLDKLVNSLTCSEAALSKLNRPGDGGAALCEIRRVASRDGRYLGRSDIDSFMVDLQMWKRCAEEAIVKLPPDKGRPGNPYIGALLLSAHSVLVSAGSTDECSTASVVYLRAICELVGYTVQSDAALRKTYENAAKKVRETSQT